ncbi:DUF2391 family protein [Halorubrum sp. DTA46]|uniref:DUF2391 family protein n=1 Tax=Halorubrum sp. DTA46 TaxID=3402162 RepID=UPI003AAAD5CD
MTREDGFGDANESGSADTPRFDGGGSDPSAGSTGAGSAAEGIDPAHGPENPDINDLLRKLDALQETVDEPHEREKVQQTISLVERMPGSSAFTTRITKFTSRDMAEAFVGAVLFSLPLLVEGGVFEIAAWFVEATFAGVPVFLLLHVAFVLTMTAGLLYYADFREIEVTHPILGVIPRRYAGILTVSLVTAAFMLLLWGRLHEEDPTALEQVGRVAVVWAAAAFGAGVGDILPGESQGDDLGEFDLGWDD